MLAPGRCSLNVSFQREVASEGRERGILDCMRHLLGQEIRIH